MFLLPERTALASPFLRAGGIQVPSSEMFWRTLIASLIANPLTAMGQKAETPRISSTRCAIPTTTKMSDFLRMPRNGSLCAAAPL